MDEQQRRREDQELPAGNGAGPGGDPNQLNDLRQAGMRFIQAGGDAVDRALAQGNSEAFLSANTQEGGQ